MKQQNGKKALACSILMLCTAVCYGLCSAGQQQRGARPQPPACVFARAAMLVCCLACRHGCCTLPLHASPDARSPPLRNLLGRRPPPPLAELQPWTPQMPPAACCKPRPIA